MNEMVPTPTPFEDYSRLNGESERCEWTTARQTKKHSITEVGQSKLDSVTERAVVA